MCSSITRPKSSEKMWNIYIYIYIDFSNSCREGWSFIHCDFLVLFMHLDDSLNFLSDFSVSSTCDEDMPSS